MKEWSTMTLEERKDARDCMSWSERKAKTDDTLEKVLGLLAGDERATEEAWKLPWGNYLVNTPEEIAAYCKSEAQEGGVANV